MNQSNVRLATRADIPAWLELAAEVEPLFGPMVHDPQFLAGLTRTIERGMAFGVWDQPASDGSLRQRFCKCTAGSSFGRYRLVKQRSAHDA